MEEEVNNNKNKIRGLIVAVSTVVVISAIMILMNIYGTSRQVETAGQFVELLADEQYSEAYNLTSIEFHQATSLDELIVYVENYPVIAGAVKTDLSYFGKENELKVVSGIISSNNEDSPLTVEFVKEGKDWRILMFSLDEVDVPADDADDDF